MQEINSAFYNWLYENIKEHYQFVRVLKIKDKDEGKGEILLYKHRSNGKNNVIRKLTGKYDAYERLVTIEHKNLSAIYEVACDGIHTIVIEEYVDGTPISFLLETRVFSLEAMCRIIIQVCDGLHALHANQIIHKDIKPENIFLSSDGTAKVIDFDIAKVYKNYEAEDTVLLGTIGYAAPEQYGEKQSDRRTDIYALGTTMNVMLTGKKPVHGIAPGKIGKVIQKCTMTSPEDRFNNVYEIKEILIKLIY